MPTVIWDALALPAALLQTHSLMNVWRPVFPVTGLETSLRTQLHTQTDTMIRPSIRFVFCLTDSSAGGRRVGRETVLSKETKWVFHNVDRVVVGSKGGAGLGTIYSCRKVSIRVIVRYRNGNTSVISK